MKKIFLLRHAEALSTFNSSERMVTADGFKQCERVAEFLKDKEMPQFIACSTSQRTKDTLAKIIELMGNKNIKIEYSEKIHNQPAEVLLEKILNINNKYDSVMLVSHNPAISILASMLSNYGCDKYKDEINRGFSPASVGLFSSNSNAWNEVVPGNSKVEWFFRP